MRRHVIASLLEALLGLIVGLVTYAAMDQHDTVGATLGIISGLLTALFASTLFAQFEVELGRRELNARLERVLDKLGDRLSSASEISEFLKHGSMKFEPSELHTVWLRLLWNTSSRYWATAYVQPETHLRIQQTGLAVQEAKIRVDKVDIKRIFIIQDESELDTRSELIQAQLRAGIDVRILRLADLDKNVMLKERVARLRTVDFSVMDTRIIWYLFLDNRRQIASAELTFDGAEAQQMEDLFRSLYSESLPASSIVKVENPLSALLPTK